MVLINLSVLAHSDCSVSPLHVLFVFCVPPSCPSLPHYLSLDTSELPGIVSHSKCGSLTPRMARTTIIRYRQQSDPMTPNPCKEDGPGVGIQTIEALSTMVRLPMRCNRPPHCSTPPLYLLCVPPSCRSVPHSLSTHPNCLSERRIQHARKVLSARGSDQKLSRLQSGFRRVGIRQHTVLNASLPTLLSLPPQSQLFFVWRFIQPLCAETLI